MAAPAVAGAAFACIYRNENREELLATY